MQFIAQKIINGGLLVLDKEIYDKLPQNFVASVPEQSSGTMSMLNLWRAWMRETAKFMALNGSTMPLMLDSDGNPWGSRPFNEKDAHELFTARWMGEDQNGNRFSWKLRNPAKDESVAPKGKRLYAMEKHQEWCLEKGIRLLNPEDSEFRRLQQECER